MLVDISGMLTQTLRIQVCSLSQIYFVDFNIQGAVQTSEFSTNAQSRFASIIFEDRTACLSAAHLTMSLLLCSSKATHRVNLGPLKGAVSAQNAFKGSETETRKLLAGTEANSVSLKVVIDLPSKQIIIFYNKATEKKS